MRKDPQHRMHASAADPRMRFNQIEVLHQEISRSREIIDSLRALGRVWREASVPQALRSFQSESGGQGWSAGFSELIAKPSNRAQFRVELERLLQSPSTDEKFRKNSSGGAASSLLPERMIDKLVQWSQTALDAISVLFGFAFVVWVEMRRSRIDRSATH